MAIALDAVASTTTTVDAASITLSHTVSGSDRLLIVGIGQRTSTSDFVSGVTYNGVAMTRLNTTSPTSARRAYMYYLVAPDTGTHDVVVSFSTNDKGSVHAASFTGIDQTTPIPDNDTATDDGAGAATTPSMDVASNGWGVAYGIGYDTGGTDGNFTIDGTTQSVQNSATNNTGSRLATKEPHQYTPPTLTFTCTAITDQHESLCACTIKPKLTFIPQVIFM